MEDKNILAPLQVAEALISGEELECTYNGTLWMKVKQEDGEVFFYNDGVYKYRIKPKTIIINGVEVPAPLTRKPESGVINSIKININCGKPVELFFKNYRDAESYRDAMLLPFNELYKG